MTSKASSSECFVYITLPGQVSAVTAGRFVLDKNTRGDLGRFVYGRSYLENRDAVEFDPVELKLSTRTYETGQLNGVFGALHDAGPDYWGRRVIEKHAGRLRSSGSLGGTAIQGARAPLPMVQSTARGDG